MDAANRARSSAVINIFPLDLEAISQSLQAELQCDYRKKLNLTTSQSLNITLTGRNLPSSPTEKKHRYYRKSNDLLLKHRNPHISVEIPVPLKFNSLYAKPIAPIQIRAKASTSTKRRSESTTKLILRETAIESRKPIKDGETIYTNDDSLASDEQWLPPLLRMARDGKGRFASKPGPRRKHREILSVRMSREISLKTRLKLQRARSIREIQKENVDNQEEKEVIVIEDESEEK